MTLVSWATSSLISGISQQPDTLRFASQAEAQENGFSSVVDGLTKRHPTEHIVKLMSQEVLNSRSVSLHTINRDTDERYIVIYIGAAASTADLLVWDIKNEVYRNVEGPGGNGDGTAALDLSYLDNTVPTAIRSMSVADNTFVVNPTVKVEKDAAIGTAMSTDAFIFVRSGLYESEYTAKLSLWTSVAGVSEEIDVSVNTWDGDSSSSLVHKHQIRFTDTVLSSYPGTWKASFLGDEWSYTDSSGTGTGAVLAASCSAYFNARNGLSASVFSTDRVNVEGDHKALDTRATLVQTPAGGAWTLTQTQANTDSEEAYIQTDNIASKLAEKLTAATSNAVFTVEGSVIKCVPTYGEDGTVTAKTFKAFQLKDSNANSLMELTHLKVDTVTNLPLTCENGFVIEVQGNAEAAEDNYYLEFEAKDGGFGAGIWKESLLGGEQYRLDKTTMPHRLERFFTAGGVPYFVWDAVTWEDRLVGDATETNAFPSFVSTATADRFITDVFFFRSRMGFLSGENVILSETGVFENFFRTATTAILDGDPIDVGVGHSSVAILHSAVAWNEKLVLFTDQTQFILEGEPYLTPQTVQVSAVTDYENYTNVRPVAAGQGVVFGYSHGDYSGIRELKQITENVYDAEDLTQAVPKYIKGIITTFAPTTLENMLVVKGSGDPSALYVYKYFFGDGQRLQSAWSKYTFGISTSVEYVTFIENTMYMVLNRPEGLHLEKMEIADGMADDGSTYVTTLDRRIDESACTSIIYRSDLGTTSFTIPYAVAGGQEYMAGTETWRTSAIWMEYQVVSRATDDSYGVPLTQEGHIFTMSTTPTGTVITVEGDLSSTPFWFGEKYTFSYQFSVPRIRESTSTRGGRGVVATGRQQIKYGTLVHDASGHFSVSVTPDGRDTQKNVFAAIVLDSGSDILGTLSLDSGGFRFPIHSKNDQVTVLLENDSPLPSNFVSIEWEADYTTQSSRYRG